MTKHALRQQLLEQLARELEVIAAAQKNAVEGAVHEESRAEGEKDTRATEASYLARGQALRVVELETEIAHVASFALTDFGPGSTISAGALVTLTSPRGERRVFLLPAGAGRRLEDDGGPVSVITPASPLGSALLGASATEDVEVELGSRVESYRVSAVV